MCLQVCAEMEKGKETCQDVTGKPGVSLHLSHQKKIGGALTPATVLYH